MYGNVSTPHKKDKKIRHYYYCKNTVVVTGYKCDFRTNLDQEEINRQVAAVISAMVNQSQFVEAIKEEIGTSVDTADLERQKETITVKLHQAEATKTRIEKQMDSLDILDIHYERKLADLQRRYDSQYDTIAGIEEQIEELDQKILLIRQEKISGDQVYQLLLAFNELYPMMTEAEQKQFMKAFVEKVEIYREKTKDGVWIRSITFNFPIPTEGGYVKEMPLETYSTIETVLSLSKVP